MAPEGRKVGSLKRRARRHLARCEMKTCRKSGRRCGAKHISKSKSTKHTSFEALLEVKMSEKCTLLWREAHFQVKMFKKLHVRTTFGRSDVFLRGRRKAFRTLAKSEKNGLVEFPKTMAGVGLLKRIWKDAFRVAGAAQEMYRDVFIRDVRTVRRSGR